MNKYVKARADYIEKEKAKETREIKRRMNTFIRTNVKRLIYAYTHGVQYAILRVRFPDFSSPAVRSAVVTRVLNELYYKGIKFRIEDLSAGPDYDIVHAIYFYGVSDAPVNLYKPEEE